MRSSSVAENTRERPDLALAFQFLTRLGLRSCSAAGSLTVLAPCGASRRAPLRRTPGCQNPYAALAGNIAKMLSSTRQQNGITISTSKSLHQSYFNIRFRCIKFTATPGQTPLALATLLMLPESVSP